MTLKDVARLAGVSHTTVSRVVNNADNVGPEIRERVQDIINQYGFTPNSSAKALISGKTNVLGLILTYDILDFSYDFLPPFLIGIMEELNKTEYSLNVYFTSMSGQRDERVKERFAYNQVDGAIILNVNGQQDFTQMIAGIDRPKVILNEKLERLPLSSVVSDDERGVYNAVDYLIRAGHRRIGFVGIKKKYPSSSSLREKAYRMALEDNGLTPDPALIGEGRDDIDQIRSLIEGFLRTPRGVDAVFACGDLAAIIIISILQQNGLRVPEDVSVCGFDGHKYSEHITPSLTTIRKDRRTMGRQAVQLLLELVHNPEKQHLLTEITVPTELVLRGSTRKKSEK